VTRTDFIDGLETTETQDALCECIQRWEDDGGQVVRECRINLYARKLSELAGMTRYEDLLSGS
jgi:hypothetical protein